MNNDKVLFARATRPVYAKPVLNENTLMLCQIGVECFCRIDKTSTQSFLILLMRGNDMVERTKITVVRAGCYNMNKNMYMVNKLTRFAPNWIVTKLYFVI